MLTKKQSKTVDKPIDIEGVHSVLALPEDYQRKLSWNLLNKVKSRIRSAAFKLVYEETKGGRDIDAANEEVASAELKFAEQDALARMGCEVLPQVTPKDNLERWLKIYFTLGRAGWKMDPNGISDSFQYIINQEKSKQVPSDPVTLKQLSDLSDVSEEAIVASFEKQKADAVARTELNCEMALLRINEITEDLINHWVDIADSDMPEGWSDDVQYAVDMAKKNEIKNPFTKTVEGKMANLITLGRFNVKNMVLKSTSDVHERNEYDSHVMQDEIERFNNPKVLTQ